MDELSPAAVDAIRELVERLASGDLAALAADGRIGRLTVEDLRRAISEYGRTLVPLPAEALAAISVYPLDAMPGGFAVDVGMWTAEEGRSDLTLQLTVIERAGAIAIAIDDLHVL
jgi:hypothetical protein